jgi:hypothetical protein
MHPSSGIPCSGPHDDGLAQAGSNEIVQIKNFDLPRETEDFHHAHVLSLDSAAPSWRPESDASKAIYHETTPVF